MDRPIVIAALAASLFLAHSAAAAVCPPGSSQKTTLCHAPSDDPATRKTLCVGNAAVRGHLSRHPGDAIGRCGLSDCGNGICEADLGETSESCIEDCRCDCQAAVDAGGLAVDLGTVLGIGTATLSSVVCSTCSADDTSIAFTFSPTLETGSTPFTFDAATLGAPQCNLLDDELGLLGTVAVSGEGTIVRNGSESQATTFTLSLVKVAGLVCTAILQLDSAAILGVSPSLTIPLSIPCGNVDLNRCPAP